MQDLYSFSCHKAECIKEDIFNKFLDKTEKKLSVRQATNDEKIDFIYKHQTGLVLKKDKKKNSNILGEFISMEDDIIALENFIKKYTYFFKLTNEIEKINEKHIFTWKNRLNATIQIINALMLNNTNFSFDIVFYNTLFLLLTPYVDFYKNNGDEYLIPYDIIKTLMPSFPEDYDDCTTITYKNRTVVGYSIPCELKENGNFDIILDDYKELLRKYDCNYFNSGIIKAFKNKSSLIKNYSQIDYLPIEFLFILLVEYNIDLSMFLPYNLSLSNITELYSKQMTKINENKLLTEALCKISKHIVSEEINRNLSRIRPKFNSDSFSPSWELEDFYSAINLSVFYMNPNYLIMRRCANSNCNRFFQVSPTNRRKKYCCTNCSQNVSQRNYMARKKTRP